MENIPIVDSHVHFWDPNQIAYDWLEGTEELNRSFSLSDFRVATDGIAIDRIVFVECNCRAELHIKEVAWVEELATQDKRIEAIVAFANLTDTANIDPNLETLVAHDLVRGIRHNIQFNQPGFATQSSFINGVKKVMALNQHFELCITHDQLGECLELIKRLPEGPLILNHCGKPGIKSGEMNLWKKQIKQLSEYEHVLCKISGLMTEADMEHWAAEDIIPYMDQVRASFGSERIVYGGDWPVCTLAGSYQDWYALVSNWTEHWSAHEKRDFYADNAIRFYRL